MATSANDFIGGGNGGISSSGSTSSPAAPHATESSAPVKTLEPPASNSGADDPSGGIPKGAGGASSTAHIGSPVTAEHERQTVVGTVLESVFGKKERTAEEADAQQDLNSSTATGTTEAAQKGGENSGTYTGAIAGAAAAGGAAVASVIPGMSSAKQGTTEDAAAASTQTGGAAGTTGTTSSTVGETAGTTGTTSSTAGETAGTTGTTSTVGEKAAAAGEAVKDTANKTAESATATANEAGAAVKNAVEGEKGEGEKGEGAEPKKVTDHQAAVRENKDAIPTAGGERIGEAHEVSNLRQRVGKTSNNALQGESKVIPDVPKKTDEEVPTTAKVEKVQGKLSSLGSSIGTNLEQPLPMPTLPRMLKNQPARLQRRDCLSLVARRTARLARTSLS